MYKAEPRAMAADANTRCKYTRHAPKVNTRSIQNANIAAAFRYVNRLPDKIGHNR